MIKLSRDIHELQDYLGSQNWLNNNESIISVEKPGDGNMNFTLRVITDDRSFIIKQSRDYVEKYPDVDAPENRVLMEYQFYNLIQDDDFLKSKTPEIRGIDRENKVMVMEDLGDSPDFTSIYKSGINITQDELNPIIDFVARMHEIYDVERDDFAFANGNSAIRNRKMRELNHEHIFVYPYMEENGLNLDEIMPGLNDFASEFKQDDDLKSKVNELGKIYLSDGNKLLHGDYFPGSWIKADNDIYVIDPEFCFFGPAEFELGVALAHLKMANQTQSIQKKMTNRYMENADIDLELMKKFAGVEILRRILGLAQLPLEISRNKRKALLQEAATIVKN